MSRVGQKAVLIPSGVEASVQQQVLTVKSAKASLSFRIPDAVTVLVASGSIQVTQRDGFETANAMQGMARTIAANMIEGVTRGFEKQLEIHGLKK